MYWLSLHGVQISQVYFRGSPISQRLMKPFRIIEAKVSVHAGPGLGNGFIAVEIDFLVFDGPPETFHKDVIQSTAPAVQEGL